MPPNALSFILWAISIVAAGCSGSGGTDGAGGQGGSGGFGGDAFAQQAYLKASNTGADDEFGHNVALSGDTLVVGVPLEDSAATGVNGNQEGNGAPDSGAVYVFTRDGDAVWTQQAYIKASNTESADFFGFSVALSGDTLAVGAPSEDSGSTGVNGAQTNLAATSGAVYVFTRDTGGTWSQQAYVKASNTDVNDEFGFSVALSGDTLAVGATVEGSKATGINGDQADNTVGWAGAVYVFTRDVGGNWSQQAYIKASNTEQGDDPNQRDRFGWSVAIDDATLAVGATGESSAATGVNGDETSNATSGSGAAYVFTRNAGIWSQQAYVKASNPDVDDHFGTNVALSGDTLVVGAPFESSAANGIDGAQDDNSAVNAGAAYVFTRDVGGTWSQQAYVKASNTDQGDQFGHSTTVAGDDLAVGAWLEDVNATGVNPDPSDNTGTASGAAYLLTRDGADWSQQAYIKASNTDSGDRFGWSVAIDDATLAVGATRESSAATGVNGNEADNSAVNAGAVYVFR